MYTGVCVRTLPHTLTHSFHVMALQRVYLYLWWHTAMAITYHQSAGGQNSEVERELIGACVCVSAIVRLVKP